MAFCKKVIVLVTWFTKYAKDCYAAANPLTLLKKMVLALCKRSVFGFSGLIWSNLEKNCLVKRKLGVT